LTHAPADAKHPGTQPGWKDILASGQRHRILVLCLGVWLHAADSMLVATIVTDIGGAPFIAWTVALYETGTIVAGAAGALLALRFGLRRAMTVAALGYAVGCGISAVAPTMEIMLVGRLAQGLGGGGLMALSLVGASTLFERVLLPRVLALVSAVWGAASFVGPFIGALFVELGSWRGGFVFFAVQALLMMALTNRVMRDASHTSEPSSNEAIFDAPRQREPRQSETRQSETETQETGAGGPAVAGNVARVSLPWRRLSLLCIAVVAIACAGVVTPWLSALAVSVGVGGLVLFLRNDGAREADRLLPKRSWDPRHPVGAALVLVFLLSAATVGVSVFGPVLLITIHQTSTMMAGYMVALISVGWTSAALLTANAEEATDGVRILGGTIAISLSLAGFAVFMASGPLWVLVTLGIVQGAGFGMSWSFILRRATAFAALDDRARLASALPTLQRTGYAIGAALAGLVANNAGFGEGVSEAAARNAAFWLYALALPLTLPALHAAWRFAGATRLPEPRPA
jgi:MFS family permease